ncbi:DUF4843 domain-containing protein [Pedobacter deserti]|uniref:DUF4843 domain-containing protein n=1 Tax=Pedobacter deserti TaxID=2817382 RepID=UPI00210C2CBD|nr:DUF4843 domain-containing protein [Pedobacter sp. SYSU D00382]
MKKYIHLILLLSTVLFACKKNDIYDYQSETDNIYLNFLDGDNNLDTSSITYSFAESSGLASDTIWVPVAVSGKRVSRERKFTLVVVDTMTTAQATLHYEPLKPFYTIPADSGKVLVPVIIKNIDPELANKSVTLGIRVVGSSDFNESLPAPIRSKKILYSNRLEQPSWWVLWQGNLGPYSRTSHRLFLISGGQDLVDTREPEAYMEIPRTLYYLDNVRNFTRDPFAWVGRFPEKGYVLTKRTDGTEDYDFYNVDAPLIKLHLKFFPQVNGYFFINENGNQIIFN